MALQYREEGFDHNFYRENCLPGTGFRRHFTGNQNNSLITRTGIWAKLFMGIIKDLIREGGTPGHFKTPLFYCTFPNH